MAEINIQQLASEIARGLQEYSQEVVKGINLKSEKISKEAVKELKKTSPKRYGKYAKAWRKKTETKFGEPNNHIIHVDKPHYRLTHLLEHGHAKVNGGRVQGQPHIEPAEREVVEKFIREVEEVIANGSR